MTEIETAVGSAVKVTCPKDELTRALSVVGRAVSTRATVQVLGGVLLRGSRGPDGAVRHRHGALAAPLGRGAGRRSTARSSRPGGFLSTLRDCCRRARSCSSIGPEQGVLEVTCGPASYKLNTYSAEDFPKLPEVEGAQTFSVDNAAFLETVSRGRARRLAGRVAPGADRRARPLRGRQADHGRDRLVPDVGQGDRAPHERQAPSSRRSSPRARSPSSRGSRRTRASSRSASRRTTSCSAPATSG